MTCREILDLEAICYDTQAVELELKAYTLTDRIREILERVTERFRELAGVLRELPESRELAPEPVPVRADR